MLKLCQLCKRLPRIAKCLTCLTLTYTIWVIYLMFSNNYRETLYVLPVGPACTGWLNKAINACVYITFTIISAYVLNIYFTIIAMSACGNNASYISMSWMGLKEEDIQLIQGWRHTTDTRLKTYNRYKTEDIQPIQDWRHTTDTRLKT